MFNHKKKGILKRISTMLLVVVLLITMCPTDMNFVSAEEGDLQDEVLPTDTGTTPDEENSQPSDTPPTTTWTAPESSYSISGGPQIGIWYTGNVSITAQSGYQISSNATTWGTELANVVSDDTTSDGVDVTFYIKEESTDTISEAITKKIYKDATNPTGSITSSVSDWSNNLTFLNKDEVETYTITANDTESGVKKIEYYVAEGENTVKSTVDLDAITTGWTEYSAAFSMDKNKVYVIYAKITDNVDHYTYVTTNGIIHENFKPSIEFVLTPSNSSDVYESAVSVNIKATDAVDKPTSGMKSIEWKVYVDDNSVAADSGTINAVVANVANPTAGELKQVLAGDVSVSTSGKIKIEATAIDFAGNVSEVYNREFRILKEQTIAFPQSAYVVKRGEAFAGVAASPADELNAGTGDITYTIDEDSASVITSINEENGAIVLSGQLGTARIKATKEADGVYREASATYTVTVEGWTASESTYTIEGSKLSGDWYGSNVSIKANTGYQISTDATNWKDSLGVVVDSETTSAGKDVSFYIKDTANGYISDIITKNFKVDTASPTGTIEHRTMSAWDKLLSFFGKENAKESYTISASDTGSQVHTKEYYLDESSAERKSVGDMSSITGWQSYTDTIYVDKNKEYVLYARITDYAGRVTYLSTSGIIHEDVEPKITFSTNPANITKFEDDFDVEITINDASPSSGIKSYTWKVLCDRKVTQDSGAEEIKTDAAKRDNPAYNELQTEVKTTITVSKEKNPSGDIEIVVTATDFSGNTGSGSIHYTMLKEQTITFPKASYEVFYGADFDAPNATAVGENGNGEITYAVTEDINHIIKKVDPDNGTITFNVDAMGTATITATKAPDDVYGTAVASYTITVKKWEASADTYIITDGVNSIEDGNIDAVWFTNDVSIKAKTGYQISQDKSVWSDKLADVVPTDTTGTTVTFYVKESATNKTSEMITKVIKRDTVYPSGDFIEAKASWGDQILNFFGKDNDVVKYEIEADDKTSKVKKIQYYIDYGVENDLYVKNESEVAQIAENEWIDYEGRISVSKEDGKIYVVYGRIIDNAGHCTYIRTQGIIHDVFEPEVMIEVDEEKSKGFHNNKNNTTYKIYKDNIFIDIKATDDKPSSGLKKVEWAVYQGDDTTVTPIQSGVVEPTVKDNPSINELQYDLSADIVVNKALYTDGKITFVVKATDFSGQTTTKEEIYYLNRALPVIEISFDNNTENQIVDGKGYFTEARKATITIKEMEELFNSDLADVKPVIDITVQQQEGVNGQGNASGAVVSDFDLVAEDEYEATIEFPANANYTWSISYTNGLGQEAPSPNVDALKTPYNFAIDKIQPKLDIQIGNSSILYKALEWIYSKETQEVTITASDSTTKVQSVHYFMTDNTDSILTEGELEALDASSWTEYSKKFSIGANTKAIIYAKAVDMSGNTEYVCSKGIVVDDKEPIVEKAEPKVELSATYGSTTVYTKDVEVYVKVKEDIPENNAYSGIREIRYEVYNREVKTQSGTLYTYDKQKESGVRTVWDSEDEDTGKYITVNAKANNGNNITVKVIATDNAGNVGYKTLDLKIDTQPPVITVTYTNNTGDGGSGDVVYFNAGRSASITIQDYNFDPAKVQLNSNGSLSGWNSDPVSGMNTATISFAADGEYYFDIGCQDALGHTAGGAAYVNSLSPNRFVVDTTSPVITVTYDNNNAANGNYYNNSRVATIQVEERNFDPARTQLTLTATDNGQQTALPTMSNWVANGDIHTATIVYDNDALYTFDFDCQDRAGNAANDIPMDTFYVDKTSPVVTISNISDKSANSGEGNIGFVITATDTNFDIFTPVLTAVIKEGDSFVTKQITGGAITNIGNGKRYTINNVDSDGIYRITCTVIDKAGNEYKEVTLEKPDGSTYVEERFGADTLLTFSTNRQGSTYELPKETNNVVSQYYVQNVTDDIVLVEVNTDTLKEQKITLNGKELKEGVDYTVSVEGEEGEWKKYTYSISSTLFEAEGQYQLVVSSTDTADNVAFSDVKNATVNFVVDRTAPVITVSGMENDGRYQVERQTVTLIPTDDGGALSSILVCTVDDAGNIMKELLNLEGDELLKALEENEGILTFEIEEGMYQNIRIICKDCSIDSAGSPNTYDNTFTQVSVSTSGVKMLFANKSFVYGSIIGIVLIVGGIAVFVIARKKKTSK